MTYPRLTGFVLHVADADRERYVLEMAQWRDETYPRLTGFVLHVADADRERYVLEMATWRDEQEGLARGRKRGAG